jgi:hypothetical protein
MRASLRSKRVTAWLVNELESILLRKLCRWDRLNRILLAPPLHESNKIKTSRT